MKSSAKPIPFTVHHHRCYLTPCKHETEVSFILFHGFAGNHTVWNSLTEKLSSYADVVSVDLFNQYQSDEDDFSSTGFSSYYRAVIKAVLQRFAEDKRAVVPLFWSLSSLLFLELALSEQLPIAEAFLLGGTASFTDSKKKTGVHPTVLKKQIRMLKRAFNEGMLELVSGFGKGAPDWFTQYRFPLSEKHLKAQLRYLLETDIREPLSRICCKLHLLHGSDDATVPLKMAHFLKQTVPDADLSVIERGTHALMLDNCEELAQCILKKTTSLLLSDTF